MQRISVRSIYLIENFLSTYERFIKRPDKSSKTLQNSFRTFPPSALQEINPSIQMNSKLDHSQITVIMVSHLLGVICELGFRVSSESDILEGSEHLQEIDTYETSHLFTNCLDVSFMWDELVGSLLPSD